MNLEFAENRDALVFEKEYNLNTKPLEIDLLVIKKEASVQIGNEIGAFPIFCRNENRLIDTKDKSKISKEPQK